MQKKMLLSILIASFILMFTFAPVLGNEVIIQPGFSVQVVTTGLININGIAVDDQGNLFVTSRGSVLPNEGTVNDGEVLKIDSAGNVSSFATGLRNPVRIVFDPDTGNLFVADSGYRTVNRDIDGLIWKVDSTGTVSLLVNTGSLTSPVDLALDNFGTLYVSELSDSPSLASGDGGVLMVDKDTGELTTFFDDGLGHPTTNVTNPVSLAFPPVGHPITNPLISDNGLNKIVQILSPSTFDVFAENPVGVVDIISIRFDPFGMFDGSQDFFAVNGAVSGQIFRLTPSGEFRHFAAGFNTPRVLAFGANGNLYVVDGGSGSIYAIRRVVAEVVPDDITPPTGAIHAHDNMLWPANNKIVTVILNGYVIDESSIARDGGGIGVSSAYLLVDGNKIILRDEKKDLLDADGSFSVTTEVEAVKGAVINVELYGTDTAPEEAGGPNSGLVDATRIRVPEDVPLLSPEDEVELSRRTPVAFEWDCESCQADRIEFSAYPDFSRALSLAVESGATSWTPDRKSWFKIKLLGIKSRKVYWRIIGTDPNGYIVQSEISSFNFRRYFWWR